MNINDELLALTSKLISYPSISPDHAGSLDYLAGYLAELGFSCKRLDRNNTANLIATIGNGEIIFAFAGHVDVVPPGKDWRYDPFILTKEGNKLFGRGIADMKGSISAFIIALKEFLQKQQQTASALAGQIMLLLTADEEAAATDGTVVLVEYLQQHNLRIKHCIVGEPSSNKIVGDMIRVGRRGSLTAHLEILGKQGHVAYPTRCDNPVHKFAPALNQLLNTTWDTGSELFPPTTLQITNMHAGLGVDNVTPANLMVNFNFRFNDLHSAESLQQRVIALLEQHRLDYKIKWFFNAKPFASSKGKLIQTIDQVIAQHIKQAVVHDTGGGTSDGRFLIAICDEIVELGLLNESIHQVNEWAYVDDLILLKDMYADILSHICLTENT